MRQLKDVLSTIVAVNKNVNWREIFTLAYFDSLKCPEELDAFPHSFVYQQLEFTLNTLTHGELCKIKPFSYFHSLCANINSRAPRLLEIV